MAVLETPVLIVGAGPVGLLTALQLAKCGIKSILVERNESTTRYPKMEWANMRSMELLSRMGIADKLRGAGVPGNYDMTCIFTTGFGDKGNEVTRWNLPAPDTMTESTRKNNDGSGHSQSGVRCSQIIVEALLAKEAQEDPLIDLRFNSKFDSLQEESTHVTSKLTKTSGEMFVIRSQFVIGCDGGGSRVRRCVDIGLTGGPVPMSMFFVHFKSKDVAKIFQYGRSWHWFFTQFGVLIAQDEVDTYTIHSAIPPDTDISTLDPHETIYKSLGASLAPCKIEVDEVLVSGQWRPAMYLADSYRSTSGRVFLAGDAAHQVIPVGGYGLNTGIADAYDIGWKLAYAIKGRAGPYLLDSYEIERRPVAAQKMEYSGNLWNVHMEWFDWITQSGNTITQHDAAGEELRQRIAKHLQNNKAENQSYGIESDYRYNGSHLIVADREVDEPAFDVEHVIPSTWPGARAPHLYLADGQTSTHHLFDCVDEFTLFDFSDDGIFGSSFAQEAAAQHVPLKVVYLPNESHVRQVYERQAVLVRPDGHVAWRSELEGKLCSDVKHVLSVSIGMTSKSQETLKVVSDNIQEGSYTGSVGDVKYEEVQGKAVWQ